RDCLTCACSSTRGIASRATAIPTRTRRAPSRWPSPIRSPLYRARIDDLRRIDGLAVGMLLDDLAVLVDEERGPPRGDDGRAADLVVLFQSVRLDRGRA